MASTSPEFPPFTRAEEEECRKAVDEVLPEQDVLFRPILGQALATIDALRLQLRDWPGALADMRLQRDTLVDQLDGTKAEIHAAWTSLGGPLTPEQTLREAVDEQLAEVEAQAKERNKANAAAALATVDAKKAAEKHQSLRRACAAACDIDVSVAEQLERWPNAVARMRQALLDLER